MSTNPKDNNVSANPRDRLLSVATELFARNGYAATTIRDICDQAGTGINMVHHYFGNKEGIYKEVVDQFSTDVFRVPARIISQPVANADAFKVLFRLYVTETLEAMLEHRQLYALVTRTQPDVPAFDQQASQFIKFVERGQELGVVDPEIEPALLTGLVVDRLMNQVLYVDWIKSAHDVSVEDPEYRENWVRANVHILLHGMLVRD